MFYLKHFIALFVLVSSHLSADEFHDILDVACIDCHSDKRKKGDLSLEIFKTQKDFYRHYDTLKDVYTQVKSKEMPPDEEDITEEERSQLITYLENIINELETKPSNQVGPTRIRRLSNYEYDKTVKAVTGVELSFSNEFLSDNGGSEGFNNDMSVLGVSPLRFERYLDAAEKIAQYSRFDWDKGFFFEKNAKFPLSKDASLTTNETQLKKLTAKLQPKDFTVKSYLPKMLKALYIYSKKGRSPKLKEKLLKDLKISSFTFSRALSYFSSPYNKEPFETKVFDIWQALLQKRFNLKELDKVAKQISKHYSNVKGKDRIFKERIDAIFEFSDKEAFRLLNKKDALAYRNLRIQQDLINNGLKSKYKNHAAKVLLPHVKSLMEKVHRGPVDKSELSAITKDFVNDYQRFGQDIAARTLVTRIFMSIRFLFRYEEKTGQKSKVTDYELASRLSYFLWSSPPDKELIDLAKKNKLNDPKTLNSQVDRMLKDPKAKALSQNFAAQWLGFGEILIHDNPDSEAYPEFNQSLAEAMFQESLLSFDHIVKNDRSLLEVIDANYTFVNNKLRKHYKMSGESHGFSKVSFKSKKRGGILSQASTLTLTSKSKETNPIFRGAWVLTRLLGTPTPPPPPGAGTLEDQQKRHKNLSLKEKLAVHRKNPDCNSCHKKIDPMGFPLENYDALGRWRNKYTNKKAIDTVAQLEDGGKITGPEDLKAYLLDRRDSFVKFSSRKLLSYALGRKIYYFDFYLINQMAEKAKQNDYRFSSMVKEIVHSYQFQHKN